jgi:hypothetical protein
MKSDDQPKIIRFINFSHWARCFAKTKNTVSFFILSMCRIELEELDRNKVYLNDQQSVRDEYKFLLKDALSDNKKYPHDGYSIILFGTQIGKVLKEGDLSEKFFNNFKKL